MSSATKAAASRGNNAKLLKGEDLKKSELQVTIFFKGVRSAPDGWDSALIADIEESHGCMAFALNKTNIGKLVDLIGDDYEEWAGYEVTLEKIKVANPAKGGILVDGLSVTAAKKSKRKVPF